MESFTGFSCLLGGREQSVRAAGFSHQRMRKPAGFLHADWQKTRTRFFCRQWVAGGTEVNFSLILKITIISSGHNSKWNNHLRLVMLFIHLKSSNLLGCLGVFASYALLRTNRAMEKITWRNECLVSLLMFIRRTVASYCSMIFNSNGSWTVSLLTLKKILKV